MQTLTIQITNWAGFALQFKNPSATAGNTATASNNGYCPYEGRITVTATANSGPVQGTFAMQSNNPFGVAYFSYTFPGSSGPTSVTMPGADQIPFISASSEPPTVMTGPNAHLTLNIYQAVAVPHGYNRALVVPLSATPYQQPDNCQDFVNSMYAPYVRFQSLITAAQTQSAATAVPFVPADFSAQRTVLASALYNACMENFAGVDGPILRFLLNYIAPGHGQRPMAMWIPNLTFQSARPNTPAIYILSGYTFMPLATTNSDGSVHWVGDNLKTFLMLLAYGAHFVAVSADKDIITPANPANNSRPLYTQFLSAPYLPKREDFANSHYCNSFTYNNTGEYYLKIESQFASRDCGLLLALLFGSTVNNDRTPAPGTFNTFMQLEGWPAYGTGGARHNQDYEAHKQTLWNISTFGACPYSEKRAATVFLAPWPWTPTVYQTTRMMPYVGAYATGTYPNGSPQSWLETDLVMIPSDAPALPAQYYE